MADNLDMCVEIWNKISPYISKKDKVYVAEALVETFDDYGMADHFSEFANRFDGVLRVAVASHFGMDDYEEE